MIWDNRDCPLCGREMEVVQGDPKDPLYLLRCPTAMDLPAGHLMLLRASYALDTISSHFELEFQNHKPVYQTLRIYPYAVKSYSDVSNIYMYDGKMNLRFIIETPHLDLPWKDTDKIIKKLSTYTLFS